MFFLVDSKKQTMLNTKIIIEKRRKGIGHD
jgi:hypothetical protein